MSNNTLSILLILCGRKNYTKRFMNYMNMVQCPYKIIIADGGQEELTWLTQVDTLTELDYEYHYFGPDKTLTEFHHKIATVVDYIDTPLTLCVDNDDFFFLSGVARDIEFLRTHPTYVSSRGSVDKFIVSGGCYGNITEKGRLYKRSSIIGETASERITEQSKLWHGAWHNIIRTKDLKCTAKITNVVNPSCFRFTEQIYGFLNSVSGNSNRDDYPYMLHQSNSPGIGAQYFGDKRQWIKSDHWIKNMSKMITAIGTTISWSDEQGVGYGIDSFYESYLLKTPEMNDIIKPNLEKSYKIGCDFEDSLYDDILSILDKINPKQQDPITAQSPFGLGTEQELSFMRTACRG